MAHCFEIKALPLIELSASLLKDIKERSEHRRWDEVFTSFDIKERSERRQWDGDPLNLTSNDAASCCRSL